MSTPLRRHDCPFGMPERHAEMPNRLARCITITTRRPAATARWPSPLSPPSMSVASCTRPADTSSGGPAATLKPSARAGSSAFAVRRTAAENDLHAARTPVPRDGEIIFQRPVFLRRAGERLDEQRWSGEIQFVAPEKNSRAAASASSGRANSLLISPIFSAALLQQATGSNPPDELVRCALRPRV